MKNHESIFLALIFMIVVACAPEGKAAQEPVKDMRAECRINAKDYPSTSWSLGDKNYSASLFTHGSASAIICVFRDHKTVIDYARIALRADEFIVSQNCLYRSKPSRSIFGVGIRAKGNDMHLRLAWEFDEKERHLNPLKPSLVKCIYSEMDE